MIDIIESWFLWAQAVFLLVVAWSWWRGPHLEGTRVWGAGLLLLNGAVTVIAALGMAGGWQEFGTIASLIDRWSDLYLLGLVLFVSKVRRSIAVPLLSIGLLALVVTAPFYVFIGGEDVQPAWVNLLRQLPLWLAVSGSGLIVLTGGRRLWDDAQAWPRTTVLAALGLRFAQVATQYFADGLTDMWTDLPPAIRASRTVDGLVFLTAVATSIRLLFASWRPSTNRPYLIALAGAWWTGGLVGLSLWRVVPSASAILFTLAIVRPAAMLSAQAKIAHAGRSPIPRAIGIACILAAVLSFVGLLVAAVFWNLSPARTVLMTVGFALPAIPLAFLSTPTSTVAPNAVRARSKMIDAERVPLPDDWQLHLEESHRDFLGLDSDTRNQVAQMKRWERLLIAIDSASELSDRAYARSTPGLHLATHCPYSQIGE